MNYVKHVKKSLLAVLIVLATFLLWMNTGTLDVPNKYPSRVFLVPNTVHYIIFNKNRINYVTYLSILSVLKVQKPDFVYIHTNDVEFEGYYWDKLRAVGANASVRTTFMEQPTHVWGQVLSSVYHSSDVARIRVLQQHGGIYLDTDVILINNLNPLRRYEMVVGWPDDAYMGTQVLLSVKSAQFLGMWLNGYKKYHPRDWYYNAGVIPTEILQTYPYIAHYENTSLGVQNLLDKLHSTEKWNWRELYSVHLLSRHNEASQNLTEERVTELNTNFGRIIQWILKM